MVPSQFPNYVPNFDNDNSLILLDNEIRELRKGENFFYRELVFDEREIYIPIHARSFDV